MIQLLMIHIVEPMTIKPSDKRKKPYTQLGIRRFKCFRKGCNNQAIHQWSICSDGNVQRPICLECDIILNKIVLQFMEFDNVDELIERYIKEN